MDTLPEEVSGRDDVVFYVSHSGGKDSQAMYAWLSKHIPHNQIVVVHADLGEVEWCGVQEHIRLNLFQHTLNVVRAQWSDGSEKTLLGMVERRFEKRPDAPCWPSSKQRYCTSDLKRDPVNKFIRNDMKARGAKIAVNCTGLRAEESAARAKKIPWQINKRLTNTVRTVYDWMPLHDWTTRQVFEEIAEAGQEPFWPYAEGNDRLSCVFCIFGSSKDLRNGAKARPELLAKYVELEQRTGYKVFYKESISERIEEKC